MTSSILVMMMAMAMATRTVVVVMARIPWTATRESSRAIFCFCFLFFRVPSSASSFSCSRLCACCQVQIETGKWMVCRWKVSVNLWALALETLLKVLRMVVRFFSRKFAAVLRTVLWTRCDLSPAWCWHACVHMQWHLLKCVGMLCSSRWGDGGVRLVVLYTVLYCTVPIICPVLVVQ